MLEYYQVFAKQIKSLPPKHHLSDFYRPSEPQKYGEQLFVCMGTGIATYALYKYLKQMADEEKLSQTYYQPDHLRTGNKAVKELHKITSISREDIKSRLAR